MNRNQGRVLVTGAGGFSGSHLVARLVKLGARVRAPVRAPVHYNSSNDWGLAT
jgi:dTDP-glucose 4,6-dehydratase